MLYFNGDKGLFFRTGKRKNKPRLKRGKWGWVL